MPPKRRAPAAPASRADTEGSQQETLSITQFLETMNESRRARRRNAIETGYTKAMEDLSSQAENFLAEEMHREKARQRAVLEKMRELLAKKKEIEDAIEGELEEVRAGFKEIGGGFGGKGVAK